MVMPLLEGEFVTEDVAKFYPRHILFKTCEPRISVFISKSNFRGSLATLKLDVYLFISRLECFHILRPFKRRGQFRLLRSEPFLVTKSESYAAMKPISLLTLLTPILALPAPQTDYVAIDPTLVPAFGIVPGIPSISQPGSCQGANGINIPCPCPPDRDEFIQRLEQFSSAGKAFDIPLSFSTDMDDMSYATQLERVDACIITLQNFDNTVKGAGCPAASAPNFITLQAGLLQGLQRDG
jgi:hypothetical protein